jgi:hypothetical protein
MACAAFVFFRQEIIVTRFLAVAIRQCHKRAPSLRPAAGLMRNGDIDSHGTQQRVNHSSLVTGHVEIDFYRSPHWNRFAVLGRRGKPPTAHGFYGRLIKGRAQGVGNLNVMWCTIRADDEPQYHGPLVTCAVLLRRIFRLGRVGRPGGSNAVRKNTVVCSTVSCTVPARFLLLDGENRSQLGPVTSWVSPYSPFD